jgi:hypothetical protein
MRPIAPPMGSTGAACFRAGPPPSRGRRARVRSLRWSACAARPASPWCPRAAIPVSPAAPPPDCVGAPSRAHPLADERGSRGRSGRADHGGRGRLRGAGGAGGSGGRRAAVPGELRRGRLGHGRRHDRHQCRRHQRAALRHDPQPRARSRSRARRRRCRRWPARTAQGQCRLRLEAALHRQRGHARHRHGGGAAPGAPAALHRDRPVGRCPTRRRRCVSSRRRRTASATRSRLSS